MYNKTMIVGTSGAELYSRYFVMICLDDDWENWHAQAALMSSCRSSLIWAFYESSEGIGFSGG